ncbi:MAG TPA: ribosome maturation factor RimP [Pyrinomonadaceae bacterium]|nr:ribosome maturation factor RimP [Pyrinomonadaceae bacterium]
MDKQQLTLQVNEITEKVTDKHNLELVKAEVVGSVKNPIIRIFIDKPKGISHEDCAAVSYAISEILDKSDFISPDYMLEVSSPGLERELYNLKDFEKFIGNLAKVKTKTPINGQKSFSGRIKAVNGEEIILSDKSKGEIKFLFEMVAKANLEIDIEEEFRRAKS